LRPYLKEDRVAVRMKITELQKFIKDMLEKAGAKGIGEIVYRDGKFYAELDLSVWGIEYEVKGDEVEFYMEVGKVWRQR